MRIRKKKEAKTISTCRCVTTARHPTRHLPDSRRIDATAFEKIVDHFTTPRKPDRDDDKSSFPSWDVDEDLADEIDCVLKFLKSNR